MNLFKIGIRTIEIESLTMNEEDICNINKITYINKEGKEKQFSNSEILKFLEELDQLANEILRPEICSDDKNTIINPRIEFYIRKQNIFKYFYIINCIVFKPDRVFLYLIDELGFHRNLKIDITNFNIIEK